MLFLTVAHMNQSDLDTVRFAYVAVSSLEIHLSYAVAGNPSTCRFPVKLLLYTMNSFKLGSLQIPAGMVPVNELSERSSSQLGHPAKTRWEVANQVAIKRLQDD